MDTVLELDKVSKRFGTFYANRDICLTLRRGEIHAILGENGAGKSTLMNILFGLYRPDSGRILLEGKEIRTESPKQMLSLGVAMVHQHFMLVPTLSVVDNVLLGMMRPFRLPRDKAVERIRTLCQQAGFEVDPYAKISDLNVGQQQRVEIIKALYRDVKILILDEPTAILTPAETEELLQMLKRLAQRGISILFISHKFNEVMSVSDRISVIRRGEMIGCIPRSEAKPEELARMMVGREVDLYAGRASGTPGDVVLDVQDLSVPCSSEKQSIKQVSFQIRAGEILAITGVEGNGQAELVEAIMGMRRIRSGRVVLHGEQIENLHPRQILNKGVGYIPGDRHRQGLILESSIADNLILECFRDPPYTSHHLMDHPKVEKLGQEQIQAFDIRAESAQQLAASLSGGNQQKIVIARALHKRPTLLVAVFPTRGLDIGAIEFIHNRMTMQRDEGCAILLVSNELDEVLSLGDRIGVMYEGQMRQIRQKEAWDRQSLGLAMAGTNTEEAS